MDTTSTSDNPGQKMRPNDHCRTTKKTFGSDKQKKTGANCSTTMTGWIKNKTEIVGGERDLQESIPLWKFAELRSVYSLVN